MKQFPKFAAFLALSVILGQFALAADPATPAPGKTTSVPLKPDAPAVYTVQKGDTLWGIAGKYLDQPWYWPEVWYLNPEVQNPHRIYPGDTLRLVYDAVTGAPQVRVERGGVERGDAVRLEPQIRSLPLDQAITPIPFEIVAAFMSKPGVVSTEEAKTLPYIVAFGDKRVVAGAGDIAYARGLAGVDPGNRYNVVHVGDPLKDPDDGYFLGFEGIYTGSARLDRAAGAGKDDLAKLMLTDSARETLSGDRLVRERLEVPLDFIPHAPARKIDGHVIAVMGGTSVIGQYQVVVVNRGKSQGLEPGNVVAVWQTGDVVKDRGPGGASNTNQFNEPFKPNVRLPSEPAGTVMVFKTYERMSYGLVMSAQNQMHVGDLIRNP